MIRAILLPTISERTRCGPSTSRALGGRRRRCAQRLGLGLGGSSSSSGGASSLTLVDPGFTPSESTISVPERLECKLSSPILQSVMSLTDAPACGTNALPNATQRPRPSSPLRLGTEGPSASSVHPSTITNSQQEQGGHTPSPASPRSGGPARLARAISRAKGCEATVATATRPSGAASQTQAGPRHHGGPPGQRARELPTLRIAVVPPSQRVPPAAATA